MADISKADLKKEIAAILEGADLTTTTAKKIRQELEEKLDANLTSRKKEIDEIVMQCLEEKQNEGKKSKGKKNGKAADDDEDEDEENGSDAEESEEEESEEEVKPKKRAPPKKAAPKRKKAADSDDESEPASEDEDEKDDDYSPAKKKKSTPKKSKSKAAKKGKGKKKGGDSDDDSDEDWGKKKKKAAAGGAKKKNSGFGKSCTLSPELAAIVGADSLPRHEVVKKIWAYIKEKNLYDPSNKQFCVCDAELLKVFGVKKFRTFGMMKFLKTHFLD